MEREIEEGRELGGGGRVEVVGGGGGGSKLIRSPGWILLPFFPTKKRKGSGRE